MKKLFFFICVFSSFFFLNNVKAISSYTITADYNDSYVYDNGEFLSYDYKNFLDNSLIPYLDEKIGNDYMYVITCYSGNFYNDYVNKTKVFIFPKHYDSNVTGNGVFGVTTSLNSGSQFNDFSIYLRFWDTSYPNGYVGASNWTAYYMMFNLSSTNYQNVIDSWVSSPIWSNSNVFANYRPDALSWDQEVSNVIVNNNYNYLIDNQYSSGKLFIYYSNEDLKMATSTNENNTFSKFIVNYNNESFEYTLGDSFPTYSSFINNFVKPPVIEDLGNNQYSVNTNNMLIDSGNLLNLTCPNDREFENGFCNVHVSDISDFNSFLHSKMSVHFNFNNSLYLDPSKYFIFTFRINSNLSFNPKYVYFKTTGNNIVNFSLKSVNYYSVGVNKDIQVVLQAPSDISSQTSVSEIIVSFDKLSKYDVNDSNFRFGAYNVYKITNYGTLAPTYLSVKEDYENNTLDGISNNSNLGFFKSFGSKYNNHGLTSVVLTPLNLIYELKNTHPSQCTPLHIPKSVFHAGSGSIEVPCVQKMINDNFNWAFGSWQNLLDFIQMFLTGIVCYNVARGYLKTVKDLQDPSNYEIEVMDL